MKFLAGVLLAAATAQAGLVPVSSAVCLTNAIVATGCSATDNNCICTADVFLNELAQCAENSATDAEQAEKIVTIADAFCGSTGTDVKGDLKKRWGGQWTNWAWGGRGWGGRGRGGHGRFRGGRPPWARPGYVWGGGRGPWSRPPPSWPSSPEQPNQPSTPNTPSQPDTPSTPSSDQPWEDWGRPGRPSWGRPGSGRPGWGRPHPTQPEPPVNTVW